MGSVLGWEQIIGSFFLRGPWSPQPLLPALPMPNTEVGQNFKTSFQIDKGTFRICSLCWVLICKIPQTTSASVWGAVALHAQILMKQPLVTPCTPSKGISELHSVHSVLPAQSGTLNSSFLLASADYIAFTTSCKTALNTWGSKCKHLICVPFAKALHLSAPRQRSLIFR